MVRNVTDLLKVVLSRMDAIGVENADVELETNLEADNLRKLTKLLLSEPERIGLMRLKYIAEKAGLMDNEIEWLLVLVREDAE